MTKKEQEPGKQYEDSGNQPRNSQYDSEITNEDKEVLNNQSQDEEKGDYFKERQEPIDYEGEDLDVPEFDEEQFNPTASKADDSEKDERPKESANSDVDIKSESETVYKGEDAERYQDPSKKTRKEDGRNSLDKNDNG